MTLPRIQRYRAPTAPREEDPLDGILLVDKPSGPTSHDVVAAIRRHFQLKKVGHGGTLDPQATGLLVILLGKGTKLSEQFMGSDKTYVGVMRFGISTDSQDAQGKVTREADFSAVTRDQVEQQMKAFTGDLYQVPPMVSAVKIDGVPLYKRARKGQTVEREAKLIHIYDFRMTSFELPRVGFEVQCTKGTYVRTLCADIGDKLGCGANLESLRRTRSGKLRVEDTFSLDDLLKLTPDQLIEKVLPIKQFSAIAG